MRTLEPSRASETSRVHVPAVYASDFRPAWTLAVSGARAPAMYGFRSSRQQSAPRKQTYHSRSDVLPKLRPTRAETKTPEPMKPGP